MKLRLALIALLTLSSVARADEGDGARAPAAPARAPRAAHPSRAPSAPAVPDRAEQEDAGDATRTDTTFAVPARARLELENFGGEITVAAWDRRAVRVQAEYSPGTSVSFEVGPATVVLRSVRLVRIPELAPRRHVRVERISIPTQVDYRLTVPRSMNLRLSGVNTQISVAGVEGDIGAETVNGRVSVRGGRGNVKASAVTGGVAVVGVHGPVEASSVNDDVTRGGMARLATRIESDEVEASTVSGDLRYSGALRPGGTYRLESHSGDLTVVLPERPDVTISADTYSGEFSSSFVVQSKSRLTSVRGRGKEFEFTLGDGRAELSLESFSGLIRLERAGEPSGHARVVHIRRDK